MFYVASAGFGGGIILGSVTTWSLASGGFFALLGLGLVILFWFQREDRLILLAGLILLSFSVGLVRTEWSERRDFFLDPRVGSQIDLSGRVASPSTQVIGGERFVLALADTHERVLVTVSTSTIVHPGDRVAVSGQLSEPKNFDPEFDYRRYLAKDQIYYLLTKSDLTSIEEGGTILGALDRGRSLFINNLERYLPDPDGPLLAGIVLGDKSGLPDNLEDLFRIVGLSHIIVLSGYNLTVVGEGVRRIFGFLPLRLALGASAAILVLFALMAGGGASVARATLMALLILTAKATGRVYDVGRALLLAGLAMLFWNPQLLVFDAGFQLSFLATAGILFGSEKIGQTFLSRVPKGWGLRDLAATTLAAQLAVLPWLIYLFGTVSLVAFPTNLLVLPLVPPLMFLGLLLGGLGFVPVIFLPLAYLAHLIIKVVIIVSEFASRLPFASLVVPKFPIVLVMVVYVSYYWWWRRLTSDDNRSDTRSRLDHTP